MIEYKFYFEIIQKLNIKLFKIFLFSTTLELTIDINIIFIFYTLNFQLLNI